MSSFSTCGHAGAAATSAGAAASTAPGSGSLEALCFFLSMIYFLFVDIVSRMSFFFFLQVLFEGYVVVQPGSTKLRTVLLDLLHRWTLLAEAMVVLVSL